MNLAVDASILIAELLRVRGRALLQRADLRILVAQEQWVETVRGTRTAGSAALEAGSRRDAEALLDEAHALVAAGAITVMLSGMYAEREAVALPLATGSAILANDPDFLRPLRPAITGRRRLPRSRLIEDPKPRREIGSRPPSTSALLGRCRRRAPRARRSG